RSRLSPPNPPEWLRFLRRDEPAGETRLFWPADVLCQPGQSSAGQNKRPWFPRTPLRAKTSVLGFQEHLCGPKQASLVSKNTSFGQNKTGSAADYPLRPKTGEFHFQT